MQTRRIAIQFETHRNCITNDLFFMLQLMDAVPDMPICADLSHYVVDREFRYPLTDTEQDYMHRILRRADSFQGRVASREQIQLQLAFPQHQKWVQLFRDWWVAGFRYWRKRARHRTTNDLPMATEPTGVRHHRTGRPRCPTAGRKRSTIRRWVTEAWQQLEAEANP